MKLHKIYNTNLVHKSFSYLWLKHSIHHFKKTDQKKCSWADKQENLNEEAKIKNRSKTREGSEGKK